MDISEPTIEEWRAARKARTEAIMEADRAYQAALAEADKPLDEIYRRQIEYDRSKKNA